MKNKMKRLEYILILTIFFIVLDGSVNGILSYASATTENGGVVISKDTFPDEYFRKKMKKCDKNKDGYLSDSEIKKITELELEWAVTSMSGIEYLTNLESFYAYGNGSTNSDEYLKERLDLTNNKKIKKVLISRYQPYEYIDVSNCRELVDLFVEGNYLKEVNMSGCKKLKSLWINSEKITSLSLDEFKNLTKLFITCDNIKELDLSNQNKLKNLRIDSKNLRSLTLGNRDKVKTLCLYVPSIMETEQLIMKFKNVTDLEVNGCQTKELDVSKLKKLKYLRIHQVSKKDKLNKVNIGNMKTLIRCYIDGKNITNVTIGKCPKLITLDVQYTSIRNIDVSGCSGLDDLHIQENPKIKTLNIAKNKNLRSLYCDRCSLKSLDVSKNLKLSRLTCDENKIKKLDISKNLKLSYLSCEENKIKKLDLSKNRKLSYLYCYANKITKLDISKTKLRNMIWNLGCDYDVEIIK